MADLSAQRTGLLPFIGASAQRGAVKAAGVPARLLY